MTSKRTEVADIDRSLYDFTYGEEGFERLSAEHAPRMPSAASSTEPGSA